MKHRVTILGACTRCRERTALTPCKVEAYAGDRDAQQATLCDPCIDKTTRAIVTREVRTEAPSLALTQVYQ